MVDKLFIEGRRWYWDSARYSSPSTERSPEVDNPSKRPRDQEPSQGEFRDRRAWGCLGTNTSGNHTIVNNNSHLASVINCLTTCDNISIVYLNVCRLKQRLLIHEFVDFISHYDVLYFVETKRRF